jgi:hypothetical protein
MPRGDDVGSTERPYVPTGGTPARDRPTPASALRQPRGDRPAAPVRAPGRKSTPAASFRSKRRPALERPPAPKHAVTAATLRTFEMTVSGVPYLLGPALTGEVGYEAAIDSAATLTVSVLDTDGELLRVLADENERLATNAVRATLAGARYALAAVEVAAATVITLTFEDEVAWRLRKFRKVRTWSRAQYTRAEAVQSMIDEASRWPHEPIRSFIPELTDTQFIRRPREPADA